MSGNHHVLTLRRRCVPAVWASLLSVALGVLPQGPTHQSRGLQHPARPRLASINGPLVILDGRGGLGQAGASTGEIVAVRPGHAIGVLVRGLPFPFAGGLAASPQGRYVAFGEDSNEDYRHAVNGVTLTEGLWLVTSAGTHVRRLLVPPRSVLANRYGPGNVLNVGPVAWSPDRSTLAYAVNPGGGAFNLSRPETKLGLWLTRYDHPRPRLLVTTAQLGAVDVPDRGAAFGMPFQIVQLSWARDGRTLAVSTFHLAPGAQTIPVIMAVDGATGHSRVLVRGGQEAVFSPTAPQLGYTTAAGSASRMMSLRVANAQGRHARVLVTVNGLMTSPAWSPDGHTLAYITDGTVIHTVDVATGTSRVALTATARGLPAGGRFMRLAWLPAGA